MFDDHDVVFLERQLVKSQCGEKLFRERVAGADLGGERDWENGDLSDPLHLRIVSERVWWRQRLGSVMTSVPGDHWLGTASS